MADDPPGAEREDPSNTANYAQAPEDILSDPGQAPIVSERDGLVAGMLQLTTDKGRPEAIKFYGSLGFGATHQGTELHLN